MGAQGFEPCPAGFFFRTAASFCESCGKSRVGAPVGHQLSANPLVVIPVQLEPAVLPSYTIPPMFALRKDQPFAWRRARRRLRNFFLRHFQR